MLILNDKNTTRDSIGFKDTDIVIRDRATGEIIFRRKNKVLIHGAETIALKLFDVGIIDSTHTEASYHITPTYDNILSLDSHITVGSSPTTSAFYNRLGYYTNATIENPKTLLFCCGQDGCGSDSSEVAAVDYKNWISATELIPFRMVETTNDLSDDNRKIYYGRKLVNVTSSATTYAAYYFKKFNAQPTISYKLGSTDIVSSTFSSTTGLISGKETAETYMDIKLTISQDDIREYFVNTTTAASAKINTIQLCSAYPVTNSTSGVTDSNVYFKNIRPVTKLNFPNESLSDSSKGIEITYRIYF